MKNKLVFVSATLIGLGLGRIMPSAEARALSCVDPDSVTVEFIDAEAPEGDIAFWRAEFAAKTESETPHQAGWFARMVLNGRTGWWRTTPEGEE